MMTASERVNNEKEKFMNSVITLGLGKTMEKKLHSVGIHSAEELTEIGSKQAVFRLKEQYPNTCVVILYKDVLFTYYPSTDPEAYLASLEKLAALPTKKVFPGHHSLDIQPEIIIRMRDAFCRLKAEGKLHHGSGTFDFGDWGAWL